MKSSLSISRIFSPIGTLFRRFHLTIFILFIVTCLAAAVLLLTNILNEASVTGDYESPISAGTIDEETLQRINSLHSSNGTLPPVQPAAGRINPFGE